MKNLLLLLLAITTLGGSALAQEEPKLDTIYLLGQRKKLVNVKSIYYSEIQYVDPETGEQKSMKTKNIQKIIFESGRKEVFNEPLVQSLNEKDWQNVVLTHKKKDVKDLYRLGTVKGESSKRNRTAKSAERTAVIRMKRRAANMGGVMILVTEKESQGGFGEVPTFYIEGEVYSFEKPKKEDDPK